MPVNTHSSDYDSVRDMLSSLVAGTLTEQVVRLVREHVATCQECRDELASWQMIAAGVLKSAPQAQPILPFDAAWEEVQHRLPEQTTSRTETRESATRLVSMPRQADARPLPIAQRRWSRPIVAFALVVAISLTSIGVFRLLHRAGNGNCETTQNAQGVTKNLHLTDLSMISPAEGWAVGDMESPVVILHYAHCQWSREQLSPTQTGIGVANLESISMLSASEGWAGGQTESGAPLLLHYHGGQWQLVNIPSIVNSAAITDLHSVSPTEAWGVLLAGNSVANFSPFSALLRYQDGSWAIAQTPLAQVLAVAPVGADDIWVAGAGLNVNGADGGDNIYFAHYHAGTWSTPQLAVDPQQAGLLLPSSLMRTHVRMISPTDGWAVIERDENPDDMKNAAVFHYDGTTWSAIQLGFTAEEVEIFSDTDGWAFTIGSTKVTQALRFENHQWRAVPWPFTTITRIQTIVRVADGEYWAVADTTSFTLPGSTLLHYIHGAWSIYGQ